MQHVENRNAMTPTEYFNSSRQEVDQARTAVKYVGLVLTNNNIYTSDKPGDSNMKRIVKHIGRAFFNVVEVVNAKCFLTLGASVLTLSTGIATHYINEENETTSLYANYLMYYGKLSLTLILSCRFLNYINGVLKNCAPSIEYIRATNNYSAAPTEYDKRVNQIMAELGDDETIDVVRLLDDLNNLSGKTITKTIGLVIFLLNHSDETSNQVTALLLGLNYADEVIAYDELKSYDDALDPEALSTISQVALKDIEQPVICEKQLYEYKNLVDWQLFNEQKKDVTCPHNRNKLLWRNVKRIAK